MIFDLFRMQVRSRPQLLNSKSVSERARIILTKPQEYPCVTRIKFYRKPAAPESPTKKKLEQVISRDPKAAIAVDPKKQAVFKGFREKYEAEPWTPHKSS